MTDKETTFVPPSATFCSIEAMEQSGVAIAKSEREKVKLEAKVLAEKTANLSEAKYLLAEFQKYVETVKKNQETKNADEKYIDIEQTRLRNKLQIMSSWEVNENMVEQLNFFTANVQECLCFKAEAQMRWKQYEEFVAQFQPTIDKINELLPATRGQCYGTFLQLLMYNEALLQKECDEQADLAQKCAFEARSEIFDRGMKYAREVEELQNLIAAKKAKQQKCFALHDEIKF